MILWDSSNLMCLKSFTACLNGAKHCWETSEQSKLRDPEFIKLWVRDLIVNAAAVTFRRWLLRVSLLVNGEQSPWLGVQSMSVMKSNISSCLLHGCRFVSSAAGNTVAQLYCSGQSNHYTTSLETQTEREDRKQTWREEQKLQSLVRRLHRQHFQAV